MNIPANLKFTEDHEWVLIDGNIATVGITEYAVEQLGDIVYIEEMEEGASFDKGEAFSSIEAVKTVSDMIMPVSGEIVEVNEDAIDEASGFEAITSDAYGKGWFIKIEMSDPSEADALLDSSAYTELIG